MDNDLAPLRVRRAIWMLYITLAVTAAPILIVLIPLGASFPGFLLATVPWMMVPPFLVVMIQRRRNWARYVFAALFLVSLAEAWYQSRFRSAGPQLPLAPYASSMIILNATALCVMAVAVGMLFGGSASHWFYRTDASAQKGATATTSRPERGGDPDRAPGGAMLNAVAIVAHVVFGLLGIPITILALMLLPLSAALYAASPASGVGTFVTVAAPFVVVALYGVAYIASLVNCQRARHFRHFTRSTLAWAFAPAPLAALILFVGHTGYGQCDSPFHSDPTKCATNAPISAIAPPPLPPVSIPQSANTPSGIAPVQNSGPTLRDPQRMTFNECVSARVGVVNARATADQQARNAEITAILHSCGEFARAVSSISPSPQSADSVPSSPSVRHSIDNPSNANVQADRCATNSYAAWLKALPTPPTYAATSAKHIEALRMCREALGLPDVPTPVAVHPLATTTVGPNLAAPMLPTALETSAANQTDVATRNALANQCELEESRKLSAFWRSRPEEAVRAAKVRELMHNCLVAQHLPDSDATRPLGR